MVCPVMVRDAVDTAEEVASPEEASPEEAAAEEAAAEEPPAEAPAEEALDGSGVLCTRQQPTNRGPY